MSLNDTGPDTTASKLAVIDIEESHNEKIYR